MAKKKAATKKKKAAPKKKKSQRKVRLRQTKKHKAARGHTGEKPTRRGAKKAGMSVKDYRKGQATHAGRYAKSTVANIDKAIKKEKKASGGKHTAKLAGLNQARTEAVNREKPKKKTAPKKKK